MENLAYKLKEEKQIEELLRWLKMGFLRKRPHERVLRAHSIKFSIDKTSDALLCIFCVISTEIIRY